MPEPTTPLTPEARLAALRLAGDVAQRHYFDNEPHDGPACGQGEPCDAAVLADLILHQWPADDIARAEFGESLATAAAAPDGLREAWVAFSAALVRHRSEAGVPFPLDEWRTMNAIAQSTPEAGGLTVEGPFEDGSYALTVPLPDGQWVTTGGESIADAVVNAAAGIATLRQKDGR